jgi:hypothetical protein
MHSGQLVFAQVMAYLPLKAFSRMVTARRAQHKVQDFSCLDQFLLLAFAQLTASESLRDIEINLRAQRKNLYHMGLRCKTVSRNTLANANRVRPWEVFADLAHHLINTARVLYADEATNSEQNALMGATVYALDSTTIDLYLSLLIGRLSEPPRLPSPYIVTFYNWGITLHEQRKFMKHSLENDHREITVFTVHGQTSAWIYKCIDYAIRYINLHEADSTVKIINIKALHVEKIKTPDYFIAKTLDKIRIYFSKLNRNYKPIEHGIKDAEEYKKPALIGANERHQVKVEKIFIYPSFSGIITTYYKCIRHFIALSFRKEPFELAILDSTHKGVKIGDIASSETLRNFQGFGGRLKRSYALFYNYFMAIIFTELYCNYMIDKIDRSCVLDSFVLTPDRTYFPEILYRIGLRSGLKVVLDDPDFVDYQIRSLAEVEDLDFCGIPVRKNADIVAYLNKRIEDPASVLHYLNRSDKLHKDLLLDINGETVEIETAEFVIVLFPHMVSDANYWRGTDGYTDLVDWLEHTIRTLVLNENVSRIFIKFHRANQFYIGDILFENYIYKKYKSCGKLVFLNRLLSPSIFKGYKNILSVTHHGSIVEELVYMRIPCVRWVNSPGGEYQFCQFQWNSRPEYESFLSNLHNVTEVSDANLSALFDFVWNYRLRKVSYRDRSPRNKFREFMRLHSSSDELNCTTEYLNMCDYKFDSTLIKNYHTWLIEGDGNSVFYRNYFKKN